jgi:hypothetical protein
MGMYTEFHFNVELRKEVPPNVINALAKILNMPFDEAMELPEHPLFRASRWAHMLTCDSYYFSADTHSTMRFDEVAHRWFLCIRCNLKNYDDEIEKFVSWITPWIEAENEAFLGFMRYEEDETPTLFYHNCKPKIPTAYMDAE